MEKDQIIILENRGLISITGDDAKEYLQNIVTNDINKVSKTKSIFSALLSPQGKYLSEFFIIKSTNGYYLDCDNKTTEELMSTLVKYKLRSHVEIKDLSKRFLKIRHFPQVSKSLVEATKSKLKAVKTEQEKLFIGNNLQLRMMKHCPK